MRITRVRKIPRSKSWSRLAAALVLSTGISWFSSCHLYPQTLENSVGDNYFPDVHVGKILRLGEDPMPEIDKVDFTMPQSKILYILQMHVSGVSSKEELTFSISMPLNVFLLIMDLIRIPHAMSLLRLPAGETPKPYLSI